ncbi:MAG: hypothetical protein KF729_13870 [Sandaracinaceae bacterium]|nr:hypothetical protein [Sandaracinaceae bacterium]
MRRLMSCERSIGSTITPGEARDRLFDALAARLGGVACGASVRRDGETILALDDATRVGTRACLAHLGLEVRGCELGALRAAIVVPRGGASSLGALREARLAVDDWSTVAHVTLGRLLAETPSWAFPIGAVVRTRDPHATHAAVTSGAVDVGALDLATLAIEGASGLETIAIGPLLPGRVWVGVPEARPALWAVFADRRLDAARKALRWLRLVAPPAGRRVNERSQPIERATRTPARDAHP